MTANCSTTKPSADVVRTEFLTSLPRIEQHARYALRRVGCPDTRADMVAETLALAWKHFVALARRGKEPETFVTTLALRCTQAVRAGRRLAGSEAAKDVLSPVAKARHRFRVERLASRVAVRKAHRTGPVDEGVVADALLTDPKARVPEQAAFRVDFPVWRARLRDRDRAVLDALAGGDRPGEVAVRFGISFGRVSQLRGEFAASWAAFHRGDR